MEAKTIIVNGGSRTGSTLTYNIIRYLLIFNNKAFQTENHLDRKLFSRKEGMWRLSKIHRWLPKENRSDSRIITNYRRPHDVVASWIAYVKAGGIKPQYLDGESILIKEIIKDVEVDMDFLSKAKDSYCLLVEYDSLYNNIEHWVNQLCKHLGFSIDKYQMNMILKDLNPETVKEKVDNLYRHVEPVTEYRRHHISDRKGKPGSFNFIEQEFKDETTQAFGKYEEWSI